MKRKAWSIVLVLVMIISLLPAMEFAAAASSSAAASDMDALSALGIDTGTSPEGYDALSTDNPYGKNTVTLTPVSELYTVGLASSVSYDDTYNSSTTLQDGSITDADHSSADSANTLTTKLFGNNAWGTTTVPGIMSSGVSSTAASGTSTAAGKYTLISTGTISNTGASDIPATGHLSDAVNASTDLGGGFKFALSSVAAGNFDGNTSGLKAQTAMVYTSDYSAAGGLYLRFGNATGGAYGSSAKTLIGTDKQIGNPTLEYDNKPVEDFAADPYQLQNYLQVATGDWNGDGQDEVAVYIPEKGNSRIVVYALQLTDADDTETAFLDPSKWAVAWTYYLHEGDVVSNMVSLVSGDVNLDGKDDLAATWGYYYGPTQNIGSTAVVMFGGKGTAMFVKSQQFSLVYGTSNIVRASFAFGDMLGTDSDNLILCGQSDADLKAGNTYTRYVAIYDWNGTGFTSNLSQNFDLFEKKDGDYVWKPMSVHGDKFYSLPLCAANAAVISQGITSKSDLLYFDGLLIKYGDNGLGIEEAWDNSAAMQKTPNSCVEYVEYGAVSGDMTGKTGAGALATMTQTLSSTSQQTAKYTVTSIQTVPTYKWTYYYKNWFYKLFDIKSWYRVKDNTQTVQANTTVTADYMHLALGTAYMVTVDPVTHYVGRNQTDFSQAICLANTDNDSSYMNYSSKHYYTYTDPKVLAVLASPPYFADLMNRDDLAGSYNQSTTSYSKTSGSGSAITATATIKIGAYVSYEHDFQVLGVTIASVEAEAQITAAFTYDWEQESTLEQTVTYTASAGEDMVAFYSVPMEIYEYTSYVPDGAGNYDKVLTNVNIPHEAAVRLISLDEYESIQKDYSVLPPIAGDVLEHTIGVPKSYPVTTDGKNVIAEYSGTPSAVGFSSTSGGSGISQEIAMSTTTSNSFSGSVAVEAKAGAGAGGFKVGVIAGAEAGAGYVMISTSGSSFSGNMQNMPIEAQPYGYGMNWRIFCYKYSDGGISFPVVSYQVSEVQSPPPLPADFTQDMAATTSDSITLKWSYDKMVSGFKIYRYYEFPEGSGSYELMLVPFTKGVKNTATNKYEFAFTDTGLSPYTEYKYQIQTVRADNPTESIYSEPMSCRTKTAVGYPIMSINGLVDGELPIYPDANSVATLVIENADVNKYTGLDYQWQKKVGGDWTDISGSTKEALTISNAGTADSGTYRCRVNCIYYDKTAAQTYYISAYSKEFSTVYSKRTPTASIFTAIEDVKPGTGGVIQDGLTANIELYSKKEGHSAAPTGNLTFMVEGTDFEYSQTVQLSASSSTKVLGEKNESKYYSTAAVTIPSLPEGVYAVSAYYSGSRVFKDMEIKTGAANNTSTGKEVLVVIGDGSTYNQSLAASGSTSAVTKFDYGTAIVPTLAKIEKNATDTSIIEKTPVTADKYRLTASGAVSGTEYADAGAFTAASAALNIGTYTLDAYFGGVLAASSDFTIGKRTVTIKIDSIGNVSEGESVVKTPPIISGTGLTSAELTELKLGYVALNSAGNGVLMTSTTEPGNYTVTPCTSNLTPADLYNDYSVTYVSGTYTIVGTTYALNAIAADYSGRAVGDVGIANTTGKTAYYTAKTNVLLYATPQAGYQVDTWTAKFANSTTKSQTGGSTYTIETQAQPVDVTVNFKPASIILGTAADPLAGGTIACTSDDTFSSGAHVSYSAEYSFAAKPNTGYHFGQWQTVSGGLTTTLVGTAQADGSNVLEKLTVGTASMTLYARFVRDSYTLTLGGDITAYYMYDKDGVPTKKYITSGSSVVGDTEITVEPKTGYSAASDKFFTVDGSATTDAASHVFKITKDTTVELDTARNKYKVALAGENGELTATVNGAEAGFDALSAVDGGSALGFTARADRGYVFDHWTVNGTAIAGATNDAGLSTLSIAELGVDTDVAAVFTQNVAYTASAVTSEADRGTMKYTLYDIYGVLVGDANTVMPDNLTVYKGEKLVLTVATNSGSMVEQWKVNGTYDYSSAKIKTISNISDDLSVIAYLKAANSYAVYYVKMGLSDSTVTAAADDTPFLSGSLVDGGSALLFRATPFADQMVDYWTVTSGDLTATEEVAAVDDAGKNIILPTYSIGLLKQNVTVRAYFTDLVTNNVSVPDTSAMGSSAITYVTPIVPTDDGICDVTACTVRAGGKLVMTFTPKEGYGTDIDHIKAVLEAKNSGASVFVTKSAGVYTATVENITTASSLTENDIYYATYTVLCKTEGLAASVDKAYEGETVTVTVTPATNYQLSKLTLNGGTFNETVSASKLVYTFSMPAEDVDVSAEYIYVAPATAPAGGGTATKTVKTIAASGGGHTIDINAEVANGIAALEMDSSTLGNLSGVLTLDLASLEGVTGATIPEQAFNSITASGGITGLVVSLPDAKVNFNAAALSAIDEAGSGAVTITALTVDTSKLSDEQKVLVGDRPVLNLTLKQGGKIVSDFKPGTVEVTVPYTLKPNEIPDAVVVWYLNDKGVLESIAGQYNAETKSVVFTTDHFSDYVIGYLPFTDISRDMWFFSSVSFAYANGLFSGVDERSFAQEETMTRAMLVTVLWRMEGKPTPKSDCTFGDVVKGEWYAQAVAWASENGIASGYNAMTFGTNDNITREQMAVIMMNYAKYKGCSLSDTNDLSSFSDAKDVSAWAETALRWANANGLINGLDGGSLLPKGETQRCQVAAILQRFSENVAEN